MSSIVKDDTGTYRWVYEFNLFTNPTIFLTVFKILGGLVVVGIVVTLIGLMPDFASGSADWEDVLETLDFGSFFLVLFLALTLLGYIVYAIMQGGRYCVVFAMDEKGIMHKQLPRQYKKAQVVSALNVIAGIATGNPTQAGIGLISARDSLSSDFSAVHSIKGSKLLRVIKVNEPMAKNQVYVEPDDYDFVFNYIVSHCPNAKTVKG